MRTLTSKEIIKAHGLYQCGLSIAKVANRFGVTRGIMWSKFKYMRLPTRGVKKAPVIVHEGMKYHKSIRDGHYRSRVGGKNIYLHVLIFGDPIPPGFALRFRDGDKDNIVKENLELYPKQEFMKHARSVHDKKIKAKISRQKE